MSNLHQVCQYLKMIHCRRLKDLRMEKWKSVTSSYNKALVFVKMTVIWRPLVNRFLNSIKNKVSYYAGVIWIYILLCLYVRKNDFYVTNCQINISFFQYHYYKTTATAKSVSPSDLIGIIFYFNS